MPTMMAVAKQQKDRKDMARTTFMRPTFQAFQANQAQNAPSGTESRMNIASSIAQGYHADESATSGASLEACMLKSLKALFQRDQAQEHSLELCVAAVMVELMRVDDRIDEAERHEILNSLKQAFQLSDGEAGELLEEAVRAADASLDLHRFTSRIVTGFSTEERIGILRRLWRIAMADGRVDPYEEQLLRRLADLLGIHHSQFITAKIDASHHL